MTRELSTRQVLLPPYSPELNPAERVFEEVRRRTEGWVYEDLAAKREVVEGYFKQLDADPQRVTSLCGQRWIRPALEARQ